MSGYETARRIRELYPSSLLPIIMVSAKAEEEDIVEGLKCGADDYVSKPFKRAELAARIRAHIRARDAFAEQQARARLGSARWLAPPAGLWAILHRMQAADQQWLLQHNLLPRNVQRKLRNGETVVAEHHGAVTVLWAEVVGLPRLAAEVPPLELVVMLNSLYTSWDELCEEEGALGVDFSGSTYVAVSGHDDNPQHMELILRYVPPSVE
ncbi:Atrial natriuretic peptide receptor B [Monoraphidium neglectum]|uniref:Atrial natriuretic peptide receptor B n=1 Tax=Monoraphidium neglectum TaxID=145388 RepID=A0A0D2K872_9CHLO|nr:Atrial natriuretic peptide receptor B [Monoraphidium neglectum]KIY92343.1 Atrial natriuretic peptide receptor B [Monoraphidium neglectum]|eukprot:XP_013891363.1 Atrial natriuretic peptide receptor B [Monoraphidium neglectum]